MQRGANGGCGPRSDVCSHRRRPLRSMRGQSGRLRLRKRVADHLLPQEQHSLHAIRIVCGRAGGDQGLAGSAPVDHKGEAMAVGSSVDEVSPETADLLEKDSRYCSYGDTVHYADPPKIFKRCDGSYLFDESDTPYLDLQMWYSAVNFGYQNRRLNEAL